MNKGDIDKIDKYLGEKEYSFKERMAFFDGCLFALDMKEKLKGGLS